MHHNMLLYLLLMLISRDGLFQKLEDLMREKDIQIETRHLIQDLLSVVNLTQKTERDNLAILAQAIGTILRSWVHLQIKCKEVYQ